jgi:Cdc6-like AAA superfamily ATPase
MDDAPILVNEDALTEAFVPNRLLHREGQIRELERCLSPALKNRSVENIFLMGTSGTGKTTIVKWILENYFQGVPAYVNCWKQPRFSDTASQNLSHVSRFAFV